MTPVADAWRRQAGRDLAHARKSFEMEDFEWACNAAQQSVEKLFKAVLIEAGWTPSSTRNLEDLAAKLIDIGVFSTDERFALGDLADLSGYAVSACYPADGALEAPGEWISAAHAAQALRTAGVTWSLFPELETNPI